jgi:hypothetical protein
MKIAEGGLYSPVMYLYNTGGIEAATDSRRYNDGSLHCACYNTARGKYVMSQWAAEITNNPDKDYELYVELLENDEYRARIEIASQEQLVLRVYNTEHDVSLPVDWLVQVIVMAKRELRQSLPSE